MCLEFPAGLVAPSEDPLDAGIRELQEETGYIGKNVKVFLMLNLAI